MAHVYSYQEGRELTWLWVARTGRGITQEALADKIGISQVHLSRIEAGVRDPRPETADALARELGLSVETIFPTNTRRSVRAILENELVKRERRNRRLRPQ